ncbi:MAG: hypothetical protein H0U76_05675 [Ktedonobacteraceae bacterium]|nr:hypothetical protein [Ktedonobacteraceae bacterium]
MGYVAIIKEQGYRFGKQAVMWAKPRLRTPAQCERWSHIVAIAHNHLVLARDVVEVLLHPWESKHRPPTPQQVRRGMNIGKAKRFPVVRKTPKLPNLIPR